MFHANRRLTSWMRRASAGLIGGLRTLGVDEADIDAAIEDSYGWAIIHWRKRRGTLATCYRMRVLSKLRALHRKAVRRGELNRDIWGALGDDRDVGQDGGRVVYRGEPTHMEDDDDATALHG